MKDTKDAVTGPHEEGRTISGVKRRGERLIGLLLAGIVLLNFPLLSVFDGTRPVFGIPFLYLYLFSVWAMIIGVMAMILRGRSARQDADKQEIKE